MIDLFPNNISVAFTKFCWHSLPRWYFLGQRTPMITRVKDIEYTIYYFYEISIWFWPELSRGFGSRGSSSSHSWGLRALAKDFPDIYLTVIIVFLFSYLQYFFMAIFSFFLTNLCSAGWKQLLSHIHFSTSRFVTNANAQKKTCSSIIVKHLW